MGLTRRSILASLGAAFAPAAADAQGFEADLALVLAVDCSFSVDATEFRLQMEGLGLAFMRQEVKDAIRRGPIGRIAVAAVQWSDDINQNVVVPWTTVGSEAECDALGVVLSAMPRRLAEGGTSISAALRYCSALFSSAPLAERRVIDISSDGRNNIGIPVVVVRDHLVAQGITINGLAILNEWPTLDIYFERNVVGGQAHFVMPSNDYAAYGDAIYRKLLREIVGPGIS